MILIACQFPLICSTCQRDCLVMMRGRGLVQAGVRLTRSKGGGAAVKADAVFVIAGVRLTRSKGGGAAVKADAVFVIAGKRAGAGKRGAEGPPEGDADMPRAGAPDEKQRKKRKHK